MVGLGQRVVAIGEGPSMECPECGRQGVFDLKFTYRSLRVGAFGCAHSFRWLFQCRSCREEWIVKRSLARELEASGVPIPFLHRDGLLVALALLTLWLFLIRT
jgi:hypothetical protein